ncbi:MAG: 1,4-dihydroxy-2-naphthoate polyprenyltransferase [bacterium]|nr:1,4-dihydroxy-2-naphthoate polyprenyltransferase [bacterium]
MNTPGAGSPWRAWVLAARVPTLTAAVAPVMVGTAAAAGGGMFAPLPAFAALIAAVSIQIATNLHNDALDFLQGADTAGRLGPARATQAGLLSPRQVLVGAYLCLGVAAAAGIYLVALRGWPLLVVGMMSMAAALAYTASPLRLGYRGLGDLFVFLFFGVVAVVGSDYVQSGEIRAVAVAASVPVGLLASAILVLNNLRDIDTDRAAGKRTLAVRLGPRATRAQYLFCLAGAMAAPAVMRLTGLLGSWFWLPWLAAPTMMGLVSTVLRHEDAAALVEALKRTARLLLIYGALLATSLLRGS